MKTPDNKTSEINAKSLVPDKNDPDFFLHMYRLYQEKVFKKCLVLLKDRTDAQDAVQEIFTQVYHHLSGFRQESKFSTWLYSITYNYCMGYLRKRHKYRKVAVSVERLPDMPAHQGEWRIRERKEKELRQVMNELPESDTRILQMKFLDQMSIKSIAGEISTTEGAVKMRIHRAKAKAQVLRWQLAS
jgi:RNA polymerase sigma-70 factor (ECF subfamily)